MPFAEIQGLSPATNDPEMEAAFRPTAELTEVTPSYLEFLQKQIELEPRGKAWSDVLTARLNVLTPYKNKELNVVTLLRMHDRHVNGFTVRVDPHSNAVVHWECS